MVGMNEMGNETSTQRFEVTAKCKVIKEMKYAERKHEGDKKLETMFDGQSDRKF